MDTTKRAVGECELRLSLCGCGHVCVSFCYFKLFSYRDFLFISTCFGINGHFSPLRPLRRFGNMSTSESCSYFPDEVIVFHDSSSSNVLFYF